MSLIGTLEQLNLSDVLQRVEAHAKTGVLMIKQEGQWIELYFREGRLMCIGPVRSDVTLADRLLQAGFISPQAKQEVMLALGASPPSETRIALTLMDLGHINHEGLRLWASRGATQVIRAVLNWPTGEVYFEEGLQPSAERLLVALPLASVLPSAPPQTPPSALSSSVALPPASISAPVPVSTVSPAPTPISISSEQARPAPVSPTSDISRLPTLFGSAQFSSGSLPATPLSNRAVPSPTLAASPAPRISITGPLGPSAMLANVPQTPMPPRPIDTSFMRPEMVLFPTDLSALRDQNPQLLLTPGQWRLFTRADGQTSLQTASMELGITSSQICQTAGELMSMRLVDIAMPPAGSSQELSSVSRDLLHGYIAFGSASSVVQPWAAASPTTDALAPSLFQKHELQRGNGGNNVSLGSGSGWGVNAAPAVSQPSGSQRTVNGSREHARTGGRR